MNKVTQAPTKDRPILLSTDMARAWDLGLKTNTRRMKGLDKVNLDPHNWSYKGVDFDGDHVFWPVWDEEKIFSADAVALPCPFGVKGDRLWPREPWRTYTRFDRLKPAELYPHTPIQYLAGGTNGNPIDGTFTPGKYRHARFMCRWMSRNLSEIVSIRAERLQDISKDDCIKEGMQGLEDVHAGWHESFARLWNSINGDGSWDRNPWVWVVVFKMVVGPSIARTLPYKP